MPGNLTSTETNMTVQAGRYTSEGWKDAVRLTNHLPSSLSLLGNYWLAQQVHRNLKCSHTHTPYVMLAWIKPQIECVNATGSAVACDPFRSTPSNPTNAFVAILKISELTEDDQNHVHTLKIKNIRGETTYSVRIQTIEGNKIWTITPDTMKHC